MWGNTGIPTAARGNSGTEELQPGNRNSGTGDQRNRGTATAVRGISGTAEPQQRYVGSAEQGNRNSGTGDQRQQRYGEQRQQRYGEQRQQRYGEQRQQRYGGTAATAVRGNSGNSGTGEQRQQRYGGTVATADRLLANAPGLWWLSTRLCCVMEEPDGLDRRRDNKSKRFEDNRSDAIVPLGSNDSKS
ncbi:hypothetical protein ACOMHN_052220 [Nucella lapillus]